MGLDIKMDRFSMIINGRREFILGGSIHYFRLPARELWPKRLALMKDAGLNAVDVYYPWNYHSEAKGAYDFTGIRDVDYFHDLIEDMGFYLIARPGPYICAEIDAGGLPGWLLAQKDLIIRCRDRKGNFRMDHDYIAYVREWYEQIVPRIAARKNLVLFQIENEFNTLPYLQGIAGALTNAIRRVNPELLMKFSTTDAFKFFLFKILPKLQKGGPAAAPPNPYFQELYKISRGLGIKVPIFHNDVQSNAGRIIDVDLAAIDDYALNTYNENWRRSRHTFNATDLIEQGHDSLGRDEPVFIAEFQGSWFDSWGGKGYERLRKVFGTDQIDIAGKTALSQRTTVVNYFMFAGGTTWGYLPSPDVYTSYDKAAPIFESGAPSERYFAIKWLGEMIRDLGPDFLQTTLDESVTCDNKVLTCRARISESGRRYVFLRNMNSKAQKARINITGREFILNPATMHLLVFNRNNSLEKHIGPYPGTQRRGLEGQELCPSPPKLEAWNFGWASPQLDPDFDGSDWKPIPTGAEMDFDSLGHHYGFVWYRGVFQGRVQSLTLDARHCFSIYLNGLLVGSRDNFKNRSGAGPDFSQTFNFSLPDRFHRQGTNALVILVESMGHNKDFESDARNPRGIIRLVTSGAEVKWTWRGGLLPGERGLCPVLEPGSFNKALSKTRVFLPHAWDPGMQGVGLYETEFDLLGVIDPESHALGLGVPRAGNKANIYLNGYLVGRYWDEVGPQHKFYLPWGALRSMGTNSLALAVWKMWDKGGLGAVRLEPYF